MSEIHTYFTFPKLLSTIFLSTQILTNIYNYKCLIMSIKTAFISNYLFHYSLIIHSFPLKQQTISNVKFNTFSISQRFYTSIFLIDFYLSNCLAICSINLNNFKPQINTIHLNFIIQYLLHLKQHAHQYKTSTVLNNLKAFRLKLMMKEPF